MALRIRLKKMGRTGIHFYRVVVMERRSNRDGKEIALLGYFDPKTKPATVKINKSEADSWIKKGALPTETVSKLLSL